MDLDLNNVIDASSLQWPEDIVAPPSWHEHAPFASWIVANLQPKLVVELGTHRGYSFLTICQAMLRANLANSLIFAVDTWQGDEHAGFYGHDVYENLSEIQQTKYGKISELLRMTFDEALVRFEDKSIDLLHIDGLHTYEAVSHDFNSWRPKLSDSGIVLIHDIAVMREGFGVYKFWAEIKNSYRTFEFKHGNGLGVVFIGDLPSQIIGLTELNNHDRSLVQTLYSRLGKNISDDYFKAEYLKSLEGTTSHYERVVEELRNALEDKDTHIRNLEAMLSAKKKIFSNPRKRV